jgi:hypothetical protein
MRCLFERAFLEAAKRRRIHHPTRLKSIIHSFQCAYLSSSQHIRQSSFPAETEQLAVHENKSDKTFVSGAMAHLLMRKGFGIRPKCMDNNCLVS